MYPLNVKKHLNVKKPWEAEPTPHLKRSKNLVKSGGAGLVAKGGARWRKAGGWVGGADEDLLPGQLLLENLITGGYIVSLPPCLAIIVPLKIHF